MTSSAIRLDDTFKAWADEQPTSCSCLYCDWCFEGSAGECRAAHVAHRLESHPELKPKRRRRTNLARFTKSRPDDYQEGAVKHAAEIRALWAKRESEAA